MNIKIILYIIVLPLTLIALDSINIENLFKKNKIFQAKLLALIISIALSYLVVDFLYDVYLNSIMF